MRILLVLAPPEHIADGADVALQMGRVGRGRLELHQALVDLVRNVLLGVDSTAVLVLKFLLRHRLLKTRRLWPIIGKVLVEHAEDFILDNLVLVCCLLINALEWIARACNRRRVLIAHGCRVRRQTTWVHRHRVRLGCAVESL